MTNKNSTTNEIERDMDSRVAIFPLGSTEQHGAHLPVCTDSLIAGKFAEKIGKDLGAYVLPVMPVGTCREHMGKKGSIWIESKTMYDLITDIVLCLRYQGFTRIVLLIAHGGLFITGPVIRELNAKYDDIKVIKADVTAYVDQLYSEGIIGSADNLHACEVETSLLMYLCPELVRRENIADFVPDVPRDYLNYRSMPSYTKSGVWGRPSLASAKKGERIFEYVSEKCTVYIKEVIEKTGNRGYTDKEK